MKDMAADHDRIMPKASTPAVQSLAGVIRPLLHSRKSKLTLGEIVDRVDGDAGLGPILFVLTLPVLLPLPPGASMLLALPLLVVAPQIIAGRRRLWLPGPLARKSIDRAALVKLLRRVLPLLEKLEAKVRPRLRILTGRIGSSIVGVACTVLALVLVLPIPFANLVPAVALGIFSLGLTRKDGLLVLIGYSLLALAGAVIAVGAHGASIGLAYLRTLL